MTMLVSYCNHGGTLNMVSYTCFNVARNRNGQMGLSYMFYDQGILFF